MKMFTLFGCAGLALLLSLQAQQEPERTESAKFQAIRHETGKSLLPWSHPHWRYYDEKAAPPENWTSPTFDDVMWKSGASPLGYGDGGVATELSYGGDEEDKNPVAFFRAKFHLDNPANHRRYACRVQVDDGAAVFLNGKQVRRINLPEGRADGSTYAAKKISGRYGDEGGYSLFEIAAGDLLPGENQLAVSVHQCNADSSDLWFNMEILGVTEEEWADLERQSHDSQLRLQEHRDRRPRPSRKIETI